MYLGLAISYTNTESPPTRIPHVCSLYMFWAELPSVVSAQRPNKGCSRTICMMSVEIANVILAVKIYV